MPESVFQAEGARLRALVSGGARVFFTPHSLSAMRDDGLVRDDVEDMLSACDVTRVEVRGGEETWRAEGLDFERRPIAAVVVPYERENDPLVKVITSWVKK